MVHNDITCAKYHEPVLPDEDGNCSLCGAALMSAESNYKKDLASWAERLESLRKCMLEPEKCPHEGGCDYASVDMCLDQIISEMQDILKAL